MRPISFAYIPYVADGGSSAVRRVKSIRGFTLIELLVTLSVGAILAAIAVPAFSNFVQDDRDIAQINSLVASFNYARSEAIKQNVTGGISVCPSADGVSCSGNSWQGGWIVTGTPAGASPPLQYVPSLGSSNSLTPTAPGAIAFFSSGLVSSALAITVCDSRGASYARDVEVNVSGRVASSQTKGVSASNAPLACP